MLYITVVTGLSASLQVLVVVTRVKMSWLWQNVIVINIL